MFHGKGYYYSKNECYEGDFKDNLFHGNGKLIKTNVEYEGSFEDGLFHGEINITYQKGIKERAFYNKGAIEHRERI